MTLAFAEQVLGWLFLLYFAAPNLGYLFLNAVSLLVILRQMHVRILDQFPQIYIGFEPPVSLVIPAYNEEANIVGSVRSLLQLNYSEFEILVVNDGSRDRTLDVLIREFALVPFPEAFRVRIPTQPVRAVYRSTVHPELRVIDKENGGKPDALNAGINGARYPLFCGLDADSILQRDSLQHVIQPFLEDARTVAAGGIVRVANGCQVSGGFLVGTGLPWNLLVLFQIVEYFRAFLFGRLGWSPMNALLIVSGAFGIFRKETVIAAGGYRTDTVGEDMELIVRLHRILSREKRAYRIVFVPDPICWTEAPEDLRSLRSQRARWQRGLSDSLAMNLGLLFARGSGGAGWVAFPFLVLFEWLSPLVEVGGYAYFLFGYWLGHISLPFAMLFLTVAVGFGTLLSVGALLLEEIAFQSYPSVRHLGLLLLVAVGENFGYRQLNTLWRLEGILRWLFRRKARWGEMRRTASWQQEQTGATRN